MMKSKFSVLEMLAMMLVFSLVTAGCDYDGGSGGSNSSITYKSISESKTYELMITKAQTAFLAVYTPTIGDTYELTVTPPGKKSTGTVEATGGTLTLKPSNGVAFTIKINGEQMTGIDGTITFTDNSNETVSNATLTPVTIGDGGQKPKSIKITGITLTEAETDGRAAVWLCKEYSSEGNLNAAGVIVARGTEPGSKSSARITDGELLFDLKEVTIENSWDATDEPWTGSGNYAICLQITGVDGWGDDGGHHHRYWWDMDDEYAKYDIKDALTTIPFSQFKMEW
jgi:hypothetical protein